MSPDVLVEEGTGGERLANFLSSLEEITPTIPDSLTSKLYIPIVSLCNYAISRLLSTEERIHHDGPSAGATGLSRRAEVHIRDF